jgi:hypothetical protein
MHANNNKIHPDELHYITHRKKERVHHITLSVEYKDYPLSKKAKAINVRWGWVENSASHTTFSGLWTTKYFSPRQQVRPARWSVHAACSISREKGPGPPLGPCKPIQVTLDQQRAPQCSKRSYPARMHRVSAHNWIGRGLASTVFWEGNSVFVLLLSKRIKKVYKKSEK